MSIINSIGNTPLVELKKIIPKSKKIKMFAKLEGANPGGSVKDRPALHMLREAENTGNLTTGHTILEATSGNTGIALAMIGAAKGYPVKLVMAASVSVERRLTLQALGAEVELTPPEQGTDGAIVRVEQLIEENPDKYFIPNQFKNNANTRAHYQTTGPEIYQQTAGQINFLVAGMETTGTLMGTSQYLKEQNTNIKIVGVEPSLGHKIQGLKNMGESIIPQIYQPDHLDQTIRVGDEEAFAYTRSLARIEGIFAGMSSGAAMAGAIKLSTEIGEGVIVVILPDRGDRYLSTNVFIH